MKLVHRDGPRQRVHLLRVNILPASCFVRHGGMDDTDLGCWWTEFGRKLRRELTRLETDTFQTIHQLSIRVDACGMFEEFAERNLQVEGGDEDDWQACIDDADRDLWGSEAQLGHIFHSEE